MEYEGRLKGKVAVVTGASRGGGRGIALVLGEEGATVYVRDAVSANSHQAKKARLTTVGRPARHETHT
jgi:NAD(P)-dependent dehydrogenase (short-subunit alcohol dehydrogenase family)